MTHLKKLRHQISAREYRHKLDPYLKTYHHYNSEVTYQDGLFYQESTDYRTLNTPVRNAQNPARMAPGN